MRNGLLLVLVFIFVFIFGFDIGVEFGVFLHPAHHVAKPAESPASEQIGNTVPGGVLAVSEDENAPFVCPRRDHIVVLAIGFQASSPGHVGLGVCSPNDDCSIVARFRTDWKIRTTCGLQRACQTLGGIL